MHAHCRPPRSLIIDYREWSFQYDQTRLKTDYEQYLFNTKGITLNDLQETVDKATILVKPYLGFFAKMEKIKNTLDLTNEDDTQISEIAKKLTSPKSDFWFKKIFGEHKDICKDFI